MKTALSFLAALSVISTAQAQNAVIDVPMAASQLDIDLMHRGETLMETGDITGARLALTPAASHGNPEAERCLAESYDPVWLANPQHNVMNADAFADIMKSIALYNQAAMHGDKVAQTRFAKDN